MVKRVKLIPIYYPVIKRLFIQKQISKLEIKRLWRKRPK